MKFSQLEKIAPALYLRRAPVHLIGAPGIGKSQWLENRLPVVIREALGVDIGVKTTMLTAYEACDIAGFKVPAKVDGAMRTVSTRPEFIPNEDEGEGIMFWDERGQAALDVQKAIAPVILSNKAGIYTIPDGWRQWSASNRMADKSGVVKAPMHLINRERTITIEPDVDSWRDNYATKAGLHHLAVGFAQFREPLFNGGVPAEPVPFLTLRSYSAAWLDVQQYIGGKDAVGAGMASDPLVNELFTASVGPQAASEILAYLGVASELRTWDEIMANPTGIKVPAGRLDVAYCYMALVLEHVAMDNVEEVFLFITNGMPKEMQLGTLTAAVKVTKGAILRHKRMREYVTANQLHLTGAFAAGA
jgi:hypothetical protein